MAILFLIAGFIFDTWNVAWLLFLTIPVFYFLYSSWENKKKQEPLPYNNKESAEFANRQHWPAKRAVGYTREVLNKERMFSLCVF